MKKEKTLEEKATYLKIVKKLHVFESAFGIISACSIANIQPNSKFMYEVLMTSGVLSIVLFYHGLCSYDKVSEDLIDLHQKIMLKDMEN